MEFEWDENKRARNVAKHGVDLIDAAFIFLGPVFTEVDTRKDYGEVRYRSVGIYDDRIYVVVHTERGGGIRLISARLGGRRDYAKYKKSIVG